MKKNRTIKKLFVFALTIVMCMSCFAVSGVAAEENTVKVRANGALVEFTDAKPYIDENNRTMMPLRAVVEALGAEVTWDGATRTASVTKNGITVKVTIGSKDIAIIKDGITTYNTMDTVAVLNAAEGRTYVPIRYVAEGLGAYVDYSDAFRVVGIYSGVLTSEEIATLRAFDYTLPQDAITYEKHKSRNTPEDTERYYGTYRHTFGNFANAHEYTYYLYGETGGGTLIYNDLGKTVRAKTTAEYYELIVAEAMAELGYNSEELVISFRADPSCIYQADDVHRIGVCVRGIVTVTFNRDWLSDLSPNARIALDNLHLSSRPKKGCTAEYYVDVHMNLFAGYNVHVNRCVELGKAK